MLDLHRPSVATAAATQYLAVRAGPRLFAPPHRDTSLSPPSAVRCPALRTVSGAHLQRAGQPPAANRRFFFSSAKGNNDELGRVAVGSAATVADFNLRKVMMMRYFIEIG